MTTRRPLPLTPALTLATALAAAVVAGCDSGPTTAPSGLRVVRMRLGDKRYDLEVAADEASREHGLMERDTLADDHGMIFVFPDSAERGFWMHHTRFPLDIVFAAADGTVVSVHTMRPYDETNVPSNGPAKYAIELAAGQANGTVKPGDKLTLPTFPATAAAK